MIKDVLKKGLLTTAGLSIITLACQVLSVAYLARKLTPEDFGIIAILVSYFTIISIFTEFSFGSNIIQRKECSKDFISTGILIVFLLSGFVFFINLFLFPIYSHLFNIESFFTYTLLAFLGLILPLSNIADALALKDLKFKKTFIAALFSNIFGVLLIPILLEMMGMGINALVAGAILAPLIKLIFLINEIYSKINFRFNLKDFYSGIKFSIYFTFAKFLSMASLQGDRVILGLQMSNHAVGIYSRGQYFSQAVINLLTVGLERVIFPVLSKTSKVDEKVEWFYELIKVTSLLTILASITLIYYSETLVQLMLGPKWNEVIPIAQVLAILVYLRSLDKIAAIYMRTDEYVKERFLFQFILTFITLFSIFFVSRLGLLYLAYVIVLVNILGGIYTQIRLSYILKVKLKCHLRIFFGTIISAFIYSIILYIGSELVGTKNLLTKFSVSIVAFIPVVIIIVLKPHWFFGINITQIVYKIVHR